MHPNATRPFFRPALRPLGAPRTLLAALALLAWAAADPARAGLPEVACAPPDAPAPLALVDGGVVSSGRALYSADELDGRAIGLACQAGWALVAVDEGRDGRLVVLDAELGWVAAIDLRGTPRLLVAQGEQAALVVERRERSILEVLDLRDEERPLRIEFEGPLSGLALVEVEGARRLLLALGTTIRSYLWPEIATGPSFELPEPITALVADPSRRGRVLVATGPRLVALDLDAPATRGVLPEEAALRFDAPVVGLSLEAAEGLGVAAIGDPPGELALFDARRLEPLAREPNVESAGRGKPLAGLSLLPGGIVGWLDAGGAGGAWRPGIEAPAPPTRRELAEARGKAAQDEAHEEVEAAASARAEEPGTEALRSARPRESAEIAEPPRRAKEPAEESAELARGGAPDGGAPGTATRPGSEAPSEAAEAPAGEPASPAPRPAPSVAPRPEEPEPSEAEPDAASATKPPTREPSEDETSPPAGVIRGTLEGAIDVVAEVVLLGPDNLLAEAARVPVVRVGPERARFEVGGLAAGRYVILPMGEAGASIATQPARARVVLDVDEGARVRFEVFGAW